MSLASRALTIIAKPAAEPSSFEISRVLYEDAVGRHRRLLADREDMLLALALATCERHVDAVGGDGADRFLSKAKRRPKALLEDLEDLNLEIDKLVVTIEPLQLAYHAHAQAETDRLATSFEERHGAAVRDIASAIEMLSIAVGTETDIRAELAAMAPLPTSNRLPDCGTSWAGALLNNPHSIGSRWIEFVKKRGYIR